MGQITEVALKTAQASVTCKVGKKVGACEVVQPMAAKKPALKNA